MVFENGLIAYHRVYWGWIGFKALQAVADRLKRVHSLRRHWVIEPIFYPDLPFPMPWCDVPRAFARLPHRAMLHHRLACDFDLSRKSRTQALPSQARIRRKSSLQTRSAIASASGHKLLGRRPSPHPLRRSGRWSGSGRLPLGRHRPRPASKNRFARQVIQLI